MIRLLAVIKAKSKKPDPAVFRFDADVNIVPDENLPTSSGEQYLFQFGDSMTVTKALYNWKESADEAA